MLFNVKPDTQQWRNSVPPRVFANIKTLAKRTQKKMAKILRNHSFVIEKYVETAVSQYIFGIFLED
jgi:hypothetical protein